MRNFYTGFDYYHNNVVIGLNKGTTYAEILGSSADPSKATDDEEKSGAIAFVMFFLIFMVSVALIFFFRAREMEKRREVKFTIIPSDAKPATRLRDGVEINPDDEISKE